jgi:hypothetical protein
VMSWELITGLTLILIAALILVAVLIRSAPTRLSWPLVGGALACLLLLGWAETALEFLRVDSTDRWLILALAAAITAAALWKGGMVAVGVLFGMAAGSVGAQFTTAYDRIDESPGLVLGVAVLATLTTGFAVARTAQRQE